MEKGKKKRDGASGIQIEAVSRGKGGVLVTTVTHKKRQT